MQTSTDIAARMRRGSTPGQLEILAPRVGLWRDSPAVGTLVRPGHSIGRLEILGRLYPLVAPPDASGIVVEIGSSDQARRPIAYGDLLLVIDPNAGAGASDEAGPAAAAAAAHEGLVFAAPMSGRYYGRPGPDRAPFITEGQVLRTGESVCLLEVMKTFNRVTFGGAGLPDEVRVKRVVPADGDDLNAQDPILELEVG